MAPRNDLASIVTQLSSIQQIFEHLVKAEEEERNRKQETEKVPLEVTGIFRLPEAIETKRSADQDKQHTTQKIIAVAAWAAFIAALAYAVIARLQLNEMQEQTREIYRQADIENQDAGVKAQQWLSEFRVAQQQAQAAEASANAISTQMRQEERAWLIPALRIVSFKPNQPLVIPITFTNIGKTAARKVHGEFVALIVKNGEAVEFTLTNNNISSWIIEWGIIFPNDPLPADIVVGRQPFKTIQDVLVIPTDVDIKQLDAGQVFLLVYGRITYRDMFNVEHWLKFCRNISGATHQTQFQAGKCLSYNDADNNQARH